MTTPTPELPPAGTPSIPATVRFALYISGAIAGLVVTYVAAKGWAGAAEVALVAGLTSLANVLAAANTPLRGGGT